MTLNLIDQAFRLRGLFSARQNSAGMSVAEVESLLNEIFQSAQQSRSRPDFIHPDTCVEMTLNWVLKCIDRLVCIHRQGVFQQKKKLPARGTMFLLSTQKCFHT